ncbi:unnamed protein product [Phytophthora lilii]|uniref:RxLR effector protein n=1 Tax=Phytophthora lilii TaxID=2077276 RepID=A0A9W6X6Q9_9STRA|nr:unnamed protein product [Phytophthora lilii]
MFHVILLAFNQSAGFESTTVLVIVSHFTIHFRRHKPPNNFRLMRLNCVFIATIFALAVGLDSTSAATDTTAIKLSNVMNSADAHRIMENDRRVLRAHKDANAETEEERGFADVVDEVMVKLKAEKILRRC